MYPKPYVLHATSIRLYAEYSAKKLAELLLKLKQFEAIYIFVYYAFVFNVFNKAHTHF